MMVNPAKIVRDGILYVRKGDPPLEGIQMQPSGIDVRVKELRQVGNFVFEVECLEWVKLPSRLAATVHVRSSLNQKGIILQTGLYDPGYHGPVYGCVYLPIKSTLSLDLGVTAAPAELDSGCRIAQIVFHQTDSHHMYAGRNNSEDDCINSIKEDMGTVLVDKAKKYGTVSYLKEPILAHVTNLNRKYLRLEKNLKNLPELSVEQFLITEEALIDLANYSALALFKLHSVFGEKPEDKEVLLKIRGEAYGLVDFVRELNTSWGLIKDLTQVVPKLGAIIGVIRDSSPVSSLFHRTLAIAVKGLLLLRKTNHVM